MGSGLAILTPEPIILEHVQLAGPTISDGRRNYHPREGLLVHHPTLTELILDKVLQQLRIVWSVALENLVLEVEVEGLAVAERHLAEDHTEAKH